MNLTVPQKIAKAMIDLRKIFPYYSAIYQVVEKESCDSVDIISVSLHKIYYNEESLHEIPYEEVLFWILHAVAHIALQHVLRKKNRDPILWNLSCDFYVNKLLAEEFHFTAPGDVVKFKDVSMKMPENIAFNRDLNLNTDYVELIYEKLKQGTAADNDRPFSELTSDEKEKNRESETSADGWTSQWEESEKSTHPTCSHTRDIFDTEQVDEDDFSVFSEFFKDRDSFLQKQNSNDLIESFESQLTKQREVEKILGDAQVKTALQNEKVEEGYFSSLLEENAEKVAFSRVDWRKLLRNFLKASNQSDTSFCHPDKRFFFHNMIVPGVVNDDESQLSGIKICLDVSGSISEENLSEFLGEIWTICKEFKVSAELIYWDTKIISVTDFEGLGDMKLLGKISGKGTDPSCLFHYFHSKQCKIKPIATLIFTDGYIRNTYATPKIKRQYKNTIWIMTQEYDKKFQPEFGTLAIPEFE